MSNIDRSVTNEMVIPRFETDLFDGHKASKFAIGIIAVGDRVIPGLEPEHEAYLALRGKVYADQTNMITRDQFRDGKEIDDDDPRSVHFGLYEQIPEGARELGGFRLIIKSAFDPRPLPIEEFFPDAFTAPAPLGSIEASRYIARHEDPSVQLRLSSVLLAGALAYIQTNNLGPTYGTVEPALETGLKYKGVPFTRIADPKMVPEYNAPNLGIQIDTEGFASFTESRTPGLLTALKVHQGDFMYFGNSAVQSRVKVPKAPAYLQAAA